jgi:3-phosphoshikimate 1-carboxyvinyltransferase
MRIKPARRVSGSLRLPGDKSISHRAAIIAALAEGTTTLENFSTSEDCASTLACLRQLGVRVERAGATVRIEGAGLEGLREPHEPLDCGNSGTTMRLLAGLLAGQDFASELTGDASLRARPMRRITEPLEQMGAQIESKDGRAPLRIRGRRPLKAIKYLMPVASAQVKACILLAGLYADVETKVIEAPQATRDHTERMLRWFGADVSQRELSHDEAAFEAISVKPAPQLKARGGKIPGDISSAAFFMIAAALLPHSQLEIKEVGLNPTRRGIIGALLGLGVDARLDVIERSGPALVFKEERGRIWRPELLDMGLFGTDFDESYGDVSISGGAGLAPLEAGRSNVLRGALIPQLIDELPVLAVLGTQVTGGLTIRDAGELRVKETDRIAATVENLRAMGAAVEEHADGLTILRRTRLRGANINSHGDHRIAMAFTIAALIADGASEIAGAECVSVSFPEFYELLESVLER